MVNFHVKKRAKCRPDAGIGNRQRDRSLQHTLRTEVFAEKRISHAYIVYNNAGSKTTITSKTTYFR